MVANGNHITFCTQQSNHAPLFCCLHQYMHRSCISSETASEHSKTQHVLRADELRASVSTLHLFSPAAGLHVVDVTSSAVLPRPHIGTYCVFM